MLRLFATQQAVLACKPFFPFHPDFQRVRILSSSAWGLHMTLADLELHLALIPRDDSPRVVMQSVDLLLVELDRKRCQRQEAFLIRLVHRR